MEKVNFTKVLESFFSVIEEVKEVPFVCEDTPENRKFIKKVYQEGVSLKLWTKGNKPKFEEDGIHFSYIYLWILHKIKAKFENKPSRKQ